MGENWLQWQDENGMYQQFELIEGARGPTWVYRGKQDNPYQGVGMANTKPTDQFNSNFSGEDFSYEGLTADSTSPDPSTLDPEPDPFSPGGYGWENAERDVAATIQNIMAESGYDARYDYNDDGTIDITDITAGISAGDYTEDDYQEMDFENEDLTSAEFRRLIQTGNQEQILEHYGRFDDEFEGILDDMDDLDFLEEQKTITGGILGDRFESAKTSYGTAIEGAQKNVGKSLFEISQGASKQESTAGFAGSGFIASTKKRSTEGVFEDYKMQQKELDQGLADAQTAFTWGTRQKDLDHTRGVENFWEDIENQFYDRLDWLETQG